MLFSVGQPSHKITLSLSGVPRSFQLINSSSTKLKGLFFAPESKFTFRMRYIYYKCAAFLVQRRLCQMNPHGKIYFIDNLII